jgi:hypothetical protein|tara:strand:- start:4778 stop:5014 length:237 start_codon:yes stop_codon:yes gene_type:complete
LLDNPSANRVTTHRQMMGQMRMQTLNSGTRPSNTSSWSWPNVTFGNLGITFGGVPLMSRSKFTCIYGYLRSPYSPSTF